MHYYYFLRSFAETDSFAVAENIKQEIIERIASFGLIKHAGCRDYWKIKEYKMIEIKLDPIDREGDLLNELSSFLGVGWHAVSKTDNIWNHWDDHTFFTPEVRWAHWERIPVVE